MTLEALLYDDMHHFVIENDLKQFFQPGDWYLYALFYMYLLSLVNQFIKTSLDNILMKL